MNQKYRVLCFGLGAIGTYVGGSLALVGHDVVFMERPEFVPDLQQNGLTLHLENREFHMQPQVVGALGDVLTQKFDFGIVALKSYDLDQLLLQLEPFKDKLPPIVCLLNGVDNERKLIHLLGADRVIAGTVTSAVGKRGNGQIVLEKKRGIGLASGHVLSGAIHEAFLEAGLNSHLYSDANSMKWSKMLTNLPANATSAILNWTALQVYTDRLVFRLEVAMLREAICVMKSLQIPVTDLPRTPVRAMSWMFNLPLWISQPLLAQTLGRGRGDKMPSFHIDLHGGRGKSEVDYLNGAVVRYATDIGQIAPINDRLTKLLLAITSGAIAISEYENQPEKLYHEITHDIKDYSLW